MTTQLEGTKFDPKVTEEDLRRIALVVNQLVQNVNKLYVENKVKTIAADYTADDTFSTLWVSATANRTIKLPNAINCPDRIYTFIKTDSSTRAMKIMSTYSGQTINGSTATSVTTQYGVRQIQTDGTKWLRII